MRNYGTDYLNQLNRDITAAHDSVGNPDYSSTISGTMVNSKHYNYKTRGIEIAGNSADQIKDVQDKLDTLKTVLNTFYTEVDDTSSNVLELATKIEEIFIETNSSLSKMTNMLKGVNEYKGHTVTHKDIVSAGIDKTKAKERTLAFWTLLIDSEVDGEALDQHAVRTYVDSLQEKKLSAEDVERLTKLSEYFSRYRFGSTGDIRDVDLDTINNGIDVYELLDPAAKSTFKEFFKDPLSKHNATIDLNITRIKYTTYTADPKYREIILHYMPEIYMWSTKKDKGVYYGEVAFFNFLNSDLETDYDLKDSSGAYVKIKPIGAFFHEFGHGVDDVTCKFGSSSSAYHDKLVQDFKDSMNKNLDASKYSSLSEKERTQLINYIISSENGNIADKQIISPINKEVINDHSKQYLPSGWSSDQKDAYIYLRECYGYKLYIMDESDKSKVYYTKTNAPKGVTLDEKTKLDYETHSDVIGGLTNNKFGGYGYWHCENPVNDPILSNERVVQTSLKDYDYWYQGMLGTKSLGSAVEHEFFAESFDKNVWGMSTEATRSVFPTASDHFDDIIDETYEDIQN